MGNLERMPARTPAWQPERLRYGASTKNQRVTDGFPERKARGRRSRRESSPSFARIDRLKPAPPKTRQVDAVAACYNRTTRMSIEADQSKFTVEDIVVRSRGEMIPLSGKFSYFARSEERRVGKECR